MGRRADRRWMGYDIAFRCTLNRSGLWRISGHHLRTQRIYQHEGNQQRKVSTHSLAFLVWCRDSEVQPSFVQLLERGGNCFPKSDFAIHARYNPGRQRIELGQHFCFHEVVDVTYAEGLQRANRKAAK